jgi:CBS-domain-containing membrane protein
MHRLLECTAKHNITREVNAVSREITMRDLEALSERHDINAFPVARNVVGLVSKFHVRLHDGSDGCPRWQVDGPAGQRVMTEAVVHVEAAAPLTRVLQPMVNLKARRVAVMDQPSGGHDLPGGCHACTQGGNREDLARD